MYNEKKNSKIKINNSFYWQYLNTICITQDKGKCHLSDYLVNMPSDLGSIKYNFILV